MLNGLVNNIFRRDIILSAIAFIGAIIVSLIVYSPRLPLNLTLTLGEASPITVKSPQFLEFQTDDDKIKTDQLIEQRKYLVEPIFSIDDSVIKIVNEKIFLFFNDIRKIKQYSSTSNDIFLSKQELDLMISYSQDELIDLETLTLVSIKEILQGGVKEINFQIIDKTL